MADKDKPSIFSKVKMAGESVLDNMIYKAQANISNDNNSQNQKDEADFVYGKSITDEPSYAINSQGYKEKPHRLMNSHLKQMSLKDSIISAIIQTRQNQVANHSKLVDNDKERGFMIKLKDRNAFLDKIKEKLKAEGQVKPDGETENQASPEDESDPSMDLNVNDPNQNKSDDEAEAFNWELERKANAQLDLEIADRRRVVEQFILNSGSIEDRPFNTKKWNFDSTLRAWSRDTLTYDFLTTEIVPSNDGKPHHFFPTDASTIKFSSPSLKNYKMFPGSQTNVDLLYPEKQIEALEKRDTLELNEELLEDEQYKYVQVVKGRIERAYTADEMKVGIRNITTDIYNNGYGVAELELLVGLVSSHLNAEYYNQAYFTQGFSAKGILHLKAPIPRRKLEMIRQQWHHMIRGARNSFQTPIFAGMDEVNWIPLTQNHSDIEFSGWMDYLVKMICAIYQIDPYEVGIGMQDRGSGGMNGDNTQEKIDLSKDKGLYPLLRFFESYINENIIDMIDSDFELVFTGLKDESSKDALDRQKEESKFKKTVNEIRAEDNLPPLPGMDNVILGPEYMQWFTQFSKEAKEMGQAEMEQGSDMGQDIQEGEEDPNLISDEDMDSMLNEQDEPEGITKSLKIEYYKIE